MYIFVDNTLPYIFYNQSVYVPASVQQYQFNYDTLNIDCQKCISIFSSAKFTENLILHLKFIHLYLSIAIYKKGILYIYFNFLGLLEFKIGP